MPRAKREIPVVRKHVLIEEPTWNKLNLLLTDPRTGKVQYGAVSKLTSSLLEKWVREQLEKRSNPQEQVHD